MASISLPIAALVVGGLGVAGSVASGLIGANAAQGAAKTQAQVAEEAAQLQYKEFQQVEGMEEPFVGLGQAAIPGLENLLGIGKGGSAGIMQQLQSLPGYQFTLGQGLQATQSGYASAGTRAIRQCPQRSSKLRRRPCRDKLQQLPESIHANRWLGGQ